jgi:hypothetical protein
VDETGNSKDISRRSALKRIGAGAAIAWSAPVLMSVGDKAFAASPTPCATTCTRCYAAIGGGCTPESAVCGSDAAGNCYCSATTEGDCFCAANRFGSGGACSDSRTCGPGERCMLICNGGCAGTFCLPPCGSATAFAPNRAGSPGSSAG